MLGPPRLLTLLLLLAAAAITRPASADVKDSSPSGFTIENTVLVPVSAATAWSALVNDVDIWWPKDHSWWGRESKLTIEARAGGFFAKLPVTDRRSIFSLSSPALPRYCA
jgi:hypothetical protein